MIFVLCILMFIIFTSIFPKEKYLTEGNLIIKPLLVDNVYRYKGFIQGVDCEVLIGSALDIECNWKNKKIYNNQAAYINNSYGVSVIKIKRTFIMSKECIIISDKQTTGKSCEN